VLLPTPSQNYAGFTSIIRCLGGQDPGTKGIVRKDDGQGVTPKCRPRESADVQFFDVQAANLDFAFVLTRRCRHWLAAFATTSSAVLPKAFDSRIAISGLMPDLLFSTLLGVCRETPSTFAPAVTESPRGSRQSSRTTRPG